MAVSARSFSSINTFMSHPLICLLKYTSLCSVRADSTVLPPFPQEKQRLHDISELKLLLQQVAKVIYCFFPMYF